MTRLEKAVELAVRETLDSVGNWGFRISKENDRTVITLSVEVLEADKEVAK